jgi:hypothetical protein
MQWRESSAQTSAAFSYLDRKPQTSQLKTRLRNAKQNTLLVQSSKSNPFKLILKPKTWQERNKPPTSMHRTTEPLNLQPDELFVAP